MPHVVLRFWPPEPRCRRESPRDRTPRFCWQQNQAVASPWPRLPTARPLRRPSGTKAQEATARGATDVVGGLLVTQCAKIAAACRALVSDAGAPLALIGARDPLATAQPARPGTARHAALEKQCRELLQQNVSRRGARCARNLHKIQLMDNIPLSCGASTRTCARPSERRGPGIRGAMLPFPSR